MAGRAGRTRIRLTQVHCQLQPCHINPGVEQSFLEFVDSARWVQLEGGYCLGRLDVDLAGSCHSPVDALPSGDDKQDNLIVLGTQLPGSWKSLLQNPPIDWRSVWAEKSGRRPEEERMHRCLCWVEKRRCTVAGAAFMLGLIISTWEARAIKRMYADVDSIAQLSSQIVASCIFPSVESML